MKTLILMRHAKSSWKDRTLDDRDRPLARRGREAAPLMARWLGAQGLLPDTVLCSPSRRTRETLELMRAAVPTIPAPQIRTGLYEAMPAALLGELRRLPKSCARVVVLGHQPGLGELLRLLVHRVRNPQDRRAFEKFPTAAIAVLEAEISRWADLGPAMAELSAFAAPRELKADRAGLS